MAKRKRKIRNIMKILFFLTALAINLSTSAFSQQNWPGVDESVVEKYAKEHGREARKPLINTDQGDLLLFFFLVAGAAGGFVAGYTWRMLMEKKSGK